MAKAESLWMWLLDDGGEERLILMSGQGGIPMIAGAPTEAEALELGHAIRHHTATENRPIRLVRFNRADTIITLAKEHSDDASTPSTS